MNPDEIRPNLYFGGCQGTDVFLFFALTALNHFFEPFRFAFLFLLLMVLQELEQGSRLLLLGQVLESALDRVLVPRVQPLVTFVSLAGAVMSKKLVEEILKSRGKHLSQIALETVQKPVLPFLKKTAYALMDLLVERLLGVDLTNSEPRGPHHLQN